MSMNPSTADGMRTACDTKTQDTVAKRDPDTVSTDDADSLSKKNAIKPCTLKKSGPAFASPESKSELKSKCESVSESEYRRPLSTGKKEKAQSWYALSQFRFQI